MDRNKVRVIIVPFLIPNWAVAQTWGRFIFVRREYADNERVIAHELSHVDQWKKLGFWRFVFTYVKELIQEGYRGNDFEEDARMDERDKQYLERARQLISARKGL